MQLHDRVRKQLKDAGTLPDGWEGDAIVLAESMSVAAAAYTRHEMLFCRGYYHESEHRTLMITFKGQMDWYRRKLRRLLKMMSRSRGKQ